MRTTSSCVIASDHSEFGVHNRVQFAGAEAIVASLVESRPDVFAASHTFARAIEPPRGQSVL
ncbi:MAG: hypothetical protein R3C20_12430 [Planctomycetaceae bacterium]